MSSSNIEEARRNRPSCASCKHQRKRCPANCVMAQHFPANRIDEFNAVQKIFGVANVTRKINEVGPEQDRAVASILWEATSWEKDPVDGPYGLYKMLEEENRLLKQQVTIQQAVQTVVEPPRIRAELMPIDEDREQTIARNSCQYGVWDGSTMLSQLGNLPESGDNIMNGAEVCSLTKFDEDNLSFIPNNGDLLESSVNSLISPVQRQQHREDQGRDGVAAPHNALPQGQGRDSHGRSVAAMYITGSYGRGVAAMYNTYGQERGTHGRGMPRMGPSLPPMVNHQPISLTIGEGHEKRDQVNQTPANIRFVDDQLYTTIYQSNGYGDINSDQMHESSATMETKEGHKKSSQVNQTPATVRSGENQLCTTIYQSNEHEHINSDQMHESSSTMETKEGHKKSSQVNQTPTTVGSGENQLCTTIYQSNVQTRESEMYTNLPPYLTPETSRLQWRQKTRDKGDLSAIFQQPLNF
ncbi:unnamed protein product [Ilex paraguariensis]|uniref:LOB domain-containing protein n=1 Tax=Ilex paraguariensis TaxID=185542 RepID=A0ABC8ULL4_9AQUA